MVEVVGRDAELGSIRAFIEQAPAALVLEGEAGIGKSTLWLAGVEYARERGLRVLTARPAEAERGLAHVGLGDLLDGVLETVLSGLTAPRRHALEVALLLKDEGTDVVDPRALGIATRSVLELLATDRPVLVAIDDLQWLDASTADALAFALRRLGGSRVLWLLARRVSDTGQESALERALAVDSVRRMPLAPLSIGALHHLLRERLGRPFGRQTLLRIHERSGGNPFFALELARGFQLDGGSLEPAAVPRTLEELVRARINGLPATTRMALAIAAAVGPTSENLLQLAGVLTKELEPAIEAHVIERDKGTIRFTHPLLSSVLYRDLGEKRWSVHRRLAEIVEDPLLKARHLALSRAVPDPAVATVLDNAARLAADRGALAVAAELAEHAFRLTPPDAVSERHGRALAAARAHHAAGEWTRARAIAADRLASTDKGPRRAELLVLLSELQIIDHAVALLEEALSEATARPALQSLIYSRLAWASRFKTGYARALDYARAGLKIAEDLKDDDLRDRAELARAILGWFVGDAEAGRGAAIRLAEGARDVVAAVGGAQLVQEATLPLVNALATSSRRDEVRAELERDYRQWRERDELRSARALWGLSWVEFWAGHWELASAHAGQAHEILTQYGIEVPQNHLPIAVVAVHRGQHQLARRHSERALELADEQFGLRPPQHLAIIGLAALWEGDATTGAEFLAKADQQAQALQWGEPTVRWWTGDYVEVLLELGQMGDAIRITDVWAADAARLGRDWVLAHVTRCRGLIAAAAGDIDEALRLLAEAVDMHQTVDDPFGRARALLALGSVRRRDRQKRPTRDAMEAALAGFEKIGAMGWAARARAELGRIGGRTHTEGLTDAESRVAELVAAGRTNREVAAALFLGERTVSSHLTHIYAKLGIRSRTELAHRLH